MQDHLSRPIKIHICKDKTLSYRSVGEPVFNRVALPVYSVNTKEEAEALLILVGRKQYNEHPQMPGQPWFKITLEGALDFKQHLDLEDLPEVRNRLHLRYGQLKRVHVPSE